MKDENLSMPWKRWPALWEAALQACERLGGEVREYSIAEPATEDDVRYVETKLGLRLPNSFRTVLLEFSGRVQMEWVLPDGLHST